MIRMWKWIIWLMIAAMFLSGSLPTLGGASVQALYGYDKGSEVNSNIVTVPTERRSEQIPVQWASEEVDVNEFIVESTGEMVVKFQDGLSEQDEIALLQSYEPTTVHMLHNHMYVVAFSELVKFQFVQAELSKHPQVMFAEPNQVITANGLIDDPEMMNEWGLETVEASSAWQRLASYRLRTGQIAEPVYVAVIDSGVDAAHEDLQGKLTAGINVREDAVNAADVTDEHGHGTHVAGTIVATVNNGIGTSGVSGSEPIYVVPIKALNAQLEAKLSTIYAAVMAAVDWRGPEGQRVKVINLSFGERFTSVPKVLEDAVQYAVDHDVLVIAAAGNEGQIVNGYYPASFPGVISVGATGENHQLVASSNKQADVHAPGQGIISTWPGNRYLSYTGTSHATGFVTAAAALLWSANPQLSVAEVRDSLIQGQAARACDSGEPMPTSECLVLSVDKALAAANIYGDDHIDQSAGFDGDFSPMSFGTGFGLTGGTGEFDYLAVVGIRPNQVTLDWELSTFDVERYELFANGSKVGEVEGSKNFGIVAGLTEMTAYEFRVEAFNSQGDRAISDTIRATTTQLTEGIGNLQAEPSPYAVYLTWDEHAGVKALYPGEAIYYNIFRDDIKINTFHTSSTRFWDTNNNNYLIPNHTYSYKVVAVDFSGVELSEYSSPVQVTTSVAGLGITTKRLDRPIDQENPTPFTTGATKPALTADGRYIVFHSKGGTKVTEEFVVPDHVVNQIYRLDQSTNELTLISYQHDNAEMGKNADDYDAIPPSISADGQRIVFTSIANNLVPGDTNGKRDIFLYDGRQTPSRITRINLIEGGTNGGEAAEGIEAVDVAGHPVISADGNTVYFATKVKLLPGEHSTNYRALYAYEIDATGQGSLSMTHDGQYRTVPSVLHGHAGFPSVSADGSTITFTITNSSSEQPQIYALDLLSDHAVLQHISNGHTTNSNNSHPGISADGRYVVYVNTATEYSVEKDRKVYVYDRIEEKRETISLNFYLAESLATSDKTVRPVISTEGRYVVYASKATNIVPQYTGSAATSQVYVYDRTNKKTYLVSQSSSGVAGANDSSIPSLGMGGGGLLIAYESGSHDLVPGFSGYQNQIYTTTLSTVLEASTPTWPSDSSLTAGNIGSGQMTLHWTPAQIQSGSISKYMIYDEADGSFVAEVGGGVHTATITGLAPDLSYKFKVEARSEMGLETSDGPSVEATTTSAQTGEALLVAELLPNGNSVRLTWEANPLQTDVAKYEIRRKSDSGGWETIHITSDASNLSYDDQGLVLSTSYDYQVYAVLTSNDAIQHSIITSVTTAGLDIDTFTWHIAHYSKMRNMAPYGEDLNLILKSRSRLSVSEAILSYKAYESGNLVNKTAIIPLTETPAQSGTYAGSFPIIEGVSELTALKMKVEDTSGHPLEVDIPDFPVGILGGLEVDYDLTSYTDANLPTGLKVQLYSAQNAAVYTLPILDKEGKVPFHHVIPGTDYKVTLFQDGMVVHVNEGVVINSGVRSIESIPNIKLLSAFAVRVVNEQDQPLPSEKVTLSHSDGKLIGAAMSNAQGIAHAFGNQKLPTGTVVQVRIASDKQYQVSTKSIHVPITHETIDIKREVKQSFSGIIRGVLKDENGVPVPNFTFALDKVDSFLSSASSVRTNDHGEFSREIPEGIYIIVQPPKYVLVSSDEKSVTGIAVLEGEPVEINLVRKETSEYRLNLELITKYEGSDWETVDLHSPRNNDYFKNKNRNETHPILHVLYYDKFRAVKGDVIKTCIDGANVDLPSECKTVIVGDDSELNISFALESAERLVTGNIKDEIGYNWEAIVFEKLASGQRGNHVTSSSFKTPSIKLALTEPGTYIMQLYRRQSSRAAVKEIEFTIPASGILDLGTIELTQGNVFAGRLGNDAWIIDRGAALGTTATVRAMYRNGEPGFFASNAKMVVGLPGGLTLVPNSIVLNGLSLASDSVDGNSLILGSLRPDESGVVQFQVQLPTAMSAGDINWNIPINMEFSGRKETIAVVDLNLQPVTLEVPERIGALTLTVSGRAPIGSYVDVYSEGEWLTGSVATEGGYWSSEITLPQKKDEYWYSIYAIASMDNKDWMSDEALTLFEADQPRLMQMTLNQLTSQTHVGTKITVNTDGNMPVFPYVTILGKPMYVELEFNKPSQISNVVVRVDGLGEAPAVWRASDRVYVAELLLDRAVIRELGFIYVDYDVEDELSKLSIGASVVPLDEADWAEDELKWNKDMDTVSAAAEAPSEQVEIEERFKVSLPRAKNFEGTSVHRFITDSDSPLGSVHTSGSIIGENVRLSGRMTLSMDKYSALDQAAPYWTSGASLNTTAMTASSVELTWTPAMDEFWLQKYRIYQDGEIIATLPGNKTTMTVGNLTPGTSYTFEVEALDASGHVTSNKLALLVEAGDMSAVMTKQEMNQFAVNRAQVLAANEYIVRGANVNRIDIALDAYGKIKSVKDGTDIATNDDDEKKKKRLDDRLDEMDACSGIPPEAKKQLEDMIENVKEQYDIKAFAEAYSIGVGILGMVSGTAPATGLILDSVMGGFIKDLKKKADKSAKELEELMDSWLNMDEAKCEDDDDEDDDEKCPPGFDCRKKSDLPSRMSSPAAAPKWIYDPSGYVFEAVEDNRIAGVKTTIMYRPKTEQGEPPAPWEFWNAEWYGQQNPMMSNSEGRYGWDVPPGMWQVIYEKDGYEPAYSEELEVLPPHFDVNEGLRSLSGPEIAYVDAIEGSGYIDLTFNKYVKVASITGHPTIDPSIALYATDGSEPVLVEVETTVLSEDIRMGAVGSGADGQELTLRARITLPDNRILQFDDDYQLIVKALLVSYADRFMAEQYEASLEIKPRDTKPPVITMLGDGQIHLTVGEGYLESGAQAYDDRDGDLTNILEIGGDFVNIQQAGMYYVTYKVTDRAGNEGTATRNVTVNPLPVNATASVFGKQEVFAHNADRHATLTLYHQTGAVVSTHVLQDNKRAHSFAVPAGDGYYVTQTVNGVESAISNKVDIKAGSIDPVAPEPVDPVGPANPVGPVGPNVPKDPVSPTGPDAGYPIDPTLDQTIVVDDGRLILHIPAGAIGGDAHNIQVHVETADGTPYPQTQGYTSLNSPTQISFTNEDEGGNITAITELLKPIQVMVQLDGTQVGLANPGKVAAFILEQGRWRYVHGVFDPETNQYVMHLGQPGIIAVMLTDKTFSDIAGHWAQEIIEVMSGRGIVEGRSNNNFDPEAPITRAEYVALLTRVLHMRALPEETSGFADVAEGDWYHGVIAAALSEQLIAGISETRFGPNLNITREQIAVLLQRAYAKVLASQGKSVSSVVDLTLASYADSDQVSDWAQDGMRFAVRYGIIQGRSKDTIAPKTMASRAEAVVMLQRFMDIIWNEMNK